MSLILAYLLMFSGSCCFYDVLGFEKFSDFLLSANQPTVHNVRVSRGRVCGCCGWLQWQVTGDTRHVGCFNLSHFLLVSVYFCIGAAICTCWKIQCLLYARCFCISALSAAHVERFNVSHMRDFCILLWFQI